MSRLIAKKILPVQYKTKPRSRKDEEEEESGTGGGNADLSLALIPAIFGAEALLDDNKEDQAKALGLTQQDWAAFSDGINEEMSPLGLALFKQGMSIAQEEGVQDAIVNSKGFKEIIRGLENGSVDVKMLTNPMRREEGKEEEEEPSRENASVAPSEVLVSEQVDSPAEKCDTCGHVAPKEAEEVEEPEWEGAGNPPESTGMVDMFMSFATVLIIGCVMFRGAKLFGSTEMAKTGKFLVTAGLQAFVAGVVKLKQK